MTDSAPLETAAGTAEGLSPREARQILDEALAMSAAGHTEVLLESRNASLTRFANNQIHQNVASRDHELVLRAIVGRRAGQASTNRLDSTALRQVADRALALARLSPEDPELPEPGPPVEAPSLDAFVPATAASAPEERAAAVAPLCGDSAARGLDASGAYEVRAVSLAYANSLGRFAHHSGTYAHFTCTVRTESSSGWVDRHRRDLRELDIERLGRIGIEKAERSRDPQGIEPGRYTVVLEPSAVAELVGFLVYLGLGAQAEQEGRSFLSGRMGQRITGERTVLADDPFHPGAMGTPFDHEGTPRRRVVLIENGIARAVVHDRRTARKAGVESTGHASPPPATEGPLPYSLVLGGGDSSVEEMIASTDRGILVTRFWYCRVVDPKQTLITGMTRDGTFLIEGGHVSRGLRNLRFNESVLDVLTRADAYGRVAEPTVFDFGHNAVVTPALRVPEFRFTGVSPF